MSTDYMGSIKTINTSHGAAQDQVEVIQSALMNDQTKSGAGNISTMMLFEGGAKVIRDRKQQDLDVQTSQSVWGKNRVAKSSRSMISQQAIHNNQMKKNSLKSSSIEPSRLRSKHNSSEEQSEEDDESEKDDIFKDEIIIKNESIKDNIGLKQAENESLIEHDPEFEVRQKIYGALLQKHDLLGIKKGGAYKKYKHQTMEQLNQSLLPGQNVVFNEYLQDEEQQQKDRKANYLNYVRQRLNYSIDCSPKKTIANQQLLAKKESIKDLEVIGSNSYYPQMGSTSMATTRTKFGFNRLQEAMSFKKQVFKHQVERNNNEKLVEIHQKLIDQQYSERFQTRSKAPFSENQSADHSFYRSTQRKQVFANIAQKTKDSFNDEHPLYIKRDRQTTDENIMLPIITQEKLIYSKYNLNEDSIKDQRQLYDLVLLKKKQSNKKSSRGNSMGSNLVQDQQRDPVKLQAKGFKKQSSLIQQQVIKNKLRKERFERMEEEQFKNEISLIAEHMIDY